MTGAIDNINYQAFLKASSNPTLQLVFNLVQKGVTQYVLRQRILILKNYYNCTPQVQRDLRIVSYMIDAFDNIANVTKNILDTEPSIQNTKKCTSCNVTTFPTVILGPNHKIIAKEGFSSLEKALSFRSPIYKIEVVAIHAWENTHCLENQEFTYSLNSIYVQTFNVKLD